MSPRRRGHLTTVSFSVSDPKDSEVSSLISDPEEPEDELQAAAERLNQDFLCQVIQEEEGQGKRADGSGDKAGSETEEVGSLCKATPLAAILGKLPSAASLGLEQNGDRKSVV